MNVNTIFSIVWTIEGLLVVWMILSFLKKENRIRSRIKAATLHIGFIAAVFFYLGHCTSILTLQLYHAKAIEVFKKHQAAIPVADRINGRWILDVPEFTITSEERRILIDNYAKSSPCYYDQGNCYFEMGGYWKNSGGYFF